MFDSGGVAGVMLGHNAREATVDLDAANRREHGALTTETSGHEVATVIILAGLVGASSAERVVSVVQGAYGGEPLSDRARRCSPIWTTFLVALTP